MEELFDSAQNNGEVPSKRKTLLDPSRKIFVHQAWLLIYPIC